MSREDPPDVIGLPVTRALRRLRGSGWAVRCRLTGPEGDRDVVLEAASSLHVVRQRPRAGGLEWLLAPAAPEPEGGSCRG